MKKLLSIIVPSFNMEAYLSRCLDSLGLEKSALSEALDVVVVNDGSKDGTSRIAHEYTERYPNAVRVIDKPNGHYGSCINAALKVVSGEFVKLLDADDYFEKDTFVLFLEHLVQLRGAGELDDVDLLVTDYATVDKDGRHLRDVSYPYPQERNISVGEFQSPLRFHILHQAVAFRASIFREISYAQSEGCPYTDLEWVTYPLYKVRQVRYLPYSIYRYFIGREGQTVSPEAFEKGVSVIIRLMRRMLSDYAVLTGRDNPGVKEYVDKVIGAQLGIIYHSFLLEQNQHLKLEDVLALDDAVRAASPVLVERSDLVLHSNLFNFHYVREFRRARTRRTFKFALYDAYVKTRRRISGAKG